MRGSRARYWVESTRFETFEYRAKRKFRIQSYQDLKKTQHRGNVRAGRRQTGHSGTDRVPVTKYLILCQAHEPLSELPPSTQLRIASAGDYSTLVGHRGSFQPAWTNSRACHAGKTRSTFNAPIPDQGLHRQSSSFPEDSTVMDHSIVAIILESMSESLCHVMQGGAACGTPPTITSELIEYEPLVPRYSSCPYQRITQAWPWL